MSLLWLLVLILVIAAIAGGVAVNGLLWLIIVVAAIVALRCSPCSAGRAAAPTDDVPHARGGGRTRTRRSLPPAAR
jgi:hypothetical protein